VWPRVHCIAACSIARVQHAFARTLQFLSCQHRFLQRSACLRCEVAVAGMVVSSLDVVEVEVMMEEEALAIAGTVVSYDAKCWWW
jgi:hypothetical protein